MAQKCLKLIFQRENIRNAQSDEKQNHFPIIWHQMLSKLSIFFFLPAHLRKLWFLKVTFLAQKCLKLTFKRENIGHAQSDEKQTHFPTF